MSPTLIVYGVMAIVILSFLGAATYKIHDAGYQKAVQECKDAAAEAKAQEEKQIATSTERKEAEDVKAKVVYKTITRDVDKVVTRVEYRNVCLPPDGLQHARRAISGALTPASEPDKPVPDAARPDRRN